MPSLTGIFKTSALSCGLQAISSPIVTVQFDALWGGEGKFTEDCSTHYNVIPKYFSSLIRSLIPLYLLSTKTQATATLCLYGSDAAHQRNPVTLAAVSCWRRCLVSGPAGSRFCFLRFTQFKLSLQPIPCHR